jgi:excisionase family DNA binding protein
MQDCSSTTEVIEMERMLTIEQVARVLQVPVATVRTWRYRGTGPAFVKVGRHVRVAEGDLIRWLEQRRSGGDPR